MTRGAHPDPYRRCAHLGLQPAGRAHRTGRRRRVRVAALAEAKTRLDAIVTQPHPYRRWVVTLALALMAAAVAILLGGSWPVAGVAALTTAVVDRTLRWLRRWGLPYLFQQAIGAAIATLVALLLLAGQGRFGWDVSLLTPSLVVASGIVVLLAGLSSSGPRRTRSPGSR